MDQWWSWILTAVGLTGFILAGRKVWWSWYVNIACQALWYAYAIVTEQWGFIVAATAYTFVFSQNAYKWTKEHFDENERWDFNDYYPRKSYCKGGLSGRIHPDCPIQDVRHVEHSWVVSERNEQA